MNTTNDADSKLLADFSERLLSWYEQNAREMPWRIPPQHHVAGIRADAYYVWLSEIMLQQTQVVTVEAYFRRFIDIWPNVFRLAEGDLDDVLKAWAGLGYYSRARNLKKCAEVVAYEYGGLFPETADELKKLPGIGDYTASALASIAFNQPVPVIDGNVERVIARHRRIEIPFPKAKPHVRTVLEDILDRNRPGEFAQATMDLGAMVCTPRKPNCAQCPVSNDCLSLQLGEPEKLPLKVRKPSKPLRKGAAFVIRNAKGDVFLCKRAETGLLAGMTQVPTTDWSVRNDGAIGAKSAPFVSDWVSIGIARHTFTHFHLELEVWETELASDPPIHGWWCQTDMLKNEALPKVMHRVLDLSI